MLNLGIICGGPSKERGISLNSARSFLDHTFPLDLNLHVLYVDPKGRYFKLTPGQLYSNTPSDFDFKLAQAGIHLDEKALIAYLQSLDLIFPLIHGAFGEDGTLQAFLEAHNIPFVGSPSGVCRRMFNKFQARQEWRQHGFETLPCLLITDINPSIEAFWNQYNLNHAVIKPTQSGSSIGVRHVTSLEDTYQAIIALRQEGFHELILEPFCEDSEFTICVLESHQGYSVSLIPLEIDIGADKHAIFDYRKKYLPSDQTRYYCPPRYSEETIQHIRREAERLFKAAGLRDFARIDGWVSPEGVVRFSDLNPISGMEQNSFIFQQSARVGISHTELICYILENALKRYSKQYLLMAQKKSSSTKKPVYVVMGGATSERQVSLMSGTNVWLKLMHSDIYQATPFLLEDVNTLWQLPYAFTLHHTVEEMVEHCHESERIICNVMPLVRSIRQQLGLAPVSFLDAPKKISFDTFIRQAKQGNAFVFIALHGGIGEDGTLQRHLENAGVAFNGSGSAASEICMDKYETARRIDKLQDPAILAMPQISFEAQSLYGHSLEQITRFWEDAVKQLNASDMIVKPQCDGCSTGVVRLSSAMDLFRYIACLRQGLRYAGLGTFQKQPSIVQMPTTAVRSFLLEPFIQTDRIHIHGTDLVHQHVSGWCEMTIGVLEEGGKYAALPPSITVAESHVLSLEEKFQGGTGINITPPPEHLLSEKALEKVQSSIAKVAQALQIGNYARIDLFVEYKTGNIRIIEANSLPALTPSTVLYHQGLCINQSPRQLLSAIIKSASQRIGRT